MLVSTKQMLLDAQKNKYAVPAFNIHNLETIQAVVEGAEKMKSPLILAVTPGTLNYAGGEYLIKIIEIAAKQSKIPIAFHLDHHVEAIIIKKLINLGCKSVMIDASQYSFEKNIEKVKEIVDYAHKFDATVEAELGKLSGNEEELVVLKKEAFYTDPQKAIEFVKRTGIDSLAVAVGTAHGLYKKEPKLDFERLQKIKQLVDIPLVLHGASGISEESIEKSIELGITKINFATELKVVFADAIKSYFKKNPNESDPRKYLTPAKNAIKDIVTQKIKMCKSSDKA